ncbi:MAG: 2Fe-2S iron-sulfur cluster-binding protein [Balneolaceae bacterium]
MPEVFIDGTTYSFEGKPKLLQFMLDHGLEVPFFCYHPSMSIPANCRQCMVKVGQPVRDRETGEYETDENGDRVIRWFPKLQTSCSTDVSDGMVVLSQETDELVTRAQKDNLELILINHPLDCPICDQAGECPLQIQTYKYGPEGSRFEVKKVHKPKRIQLGPRVILDAERCINCTRCTRFTDEISQTHQLTITRRGDKNHPTTAPGESFDDPYSLNTVDICPVGALTSADFRFQARVWEMSQTPSIDITGGKGSNVDLWTRDNLVLRITPRENPDVNDHWMPDAGREAYKRFNENRVSRPSLKLDESTQAKISWNNAVETLAEKVTGVMPNQVLLIGSPHASIEENALLLQLSEQLGLPTPIFTPHIVEGAGDDFLLTDDQAPNTEGVRLLGLEEVPSAELSDRVNSQDIQVVLLLNDHLLDRQVLLPSDMSDKWIAMFATNYSETTRRADLLFPITCIAEHAASYVNIDRRIQRSIPAKETRYTDRRLDLEMSEGRLDRYGTNFDNWRSDENKVDCVPLWELFTHLSDALDLNIRHESSRELLSSLSSSIPELQGVSYEEMDKRMGISLDKKTEHVTS